MIRMLVAFIVVWIGVLFGGIIFKQASWQEKKKFFKWMGISLLTSLATFAILLLLVLTF